VLNAAWAGFVAFVIFLIWLSHASFWRIAELEVSGTETVATEALEARSREVLAGAYFGLVPRDNILFYPKEDLMKELRAAYPTLREVQVEARNFKTIAIVAQDRAPRALWCGVIPTVPEPCVLVDEEGVVYAGAPAFSQSPFVRYFGQVVGAALPQQYLSLEEFRALAALVDAIAAKHPQEQVSSVWTNEDGDVRMSFVSGFTLIFTLQDDGGDVFERFNLALEADPFSGRSLGEFEYLDLRFGDRLYYKAK
jgi:hypothetical protein